MPSFPGHQYLGPGNPLRNGDPVHKDDGIASRMTKLTSEPQVTKTSLRLTRHLQLSSCMTLDALVTGTLH
ncbi:hypothetical protein MRX96_000975 [Rhipicephalus microplus]